MNAHTHQEKTPSCKANLEESRTPRFNVPVRHPSRWAVLLDTVLASPMRLHRYRDLSRRIVEDTMRGQDCGGHQ